MRENVEENKAIIPRSRAHHFIVVALTTARSRAKVPNEISTLPIALSLSLSLIFVKSSTPKRALEGRPYVLESGNFAATQSAREVNERAREREKKRKKRNCEYSSKGEREREREEGERGCVYYYEVLRRRGRGRRLRATERESFRWACARVPQGCQPVVRK